MSIFGAENDKALNTRYHERYENLVYTDHVMMGLCNHRDYGGNVVSVRVKYGYSPGVGATASTAIANSASTKRQQFLLTPNVCYGVEDVPNPDAVFSEGKDNAIVEIFGDANDSAMQAAGDQVEMGLFSDGFGTLATIKSHSSLVLTLTVATDCFKFQVGQQLVSKATPSSASLDTGIAIVSAIDFTNAQITVTTSTSWVATDGHVLGLSGTMQASTSPVTWLGLKAWLDPAGGAIGGVTRTGDITRLAGHYFDGTGTNVLDAVETVAMNIGNVSGARPDLVICNYTQYGKLQRILDNRAREIQSKGDGIDVFYDGISWQGPKGKMVCHPATFCGAQDVFVLDSRTWWLAAPKKRVVQPATLDGSPVNLITGDTTQVRMRGQGYFYCDAPAFNGRTLVAP